MWTTTNGCMYLLGILPFPLLRHWNEQYCWMQHFGSWFSWWKRLPSVLNHTAFNWKLPRSELYISSLRFLSQLPTAPHCSLIPARPSPQAPSPSCPFISFNAWLSVSTICASSTPSWISPKLFKNTSEIKLIFCLSLRVWALLYYFTIPCKLLPPMLHFQYTYAEFLKYCESWEKFKFLFYNQYIVHIR